MNTMNLLCHCGNLCPSPPFEGCVFNHPTVMSSLIWAIVIIVLGLLAYCYLKKKAQMKVEIAGANQNHEMKLKDKTFEQERYWYFQKELKKDYQKELYDRIQQLENEKKKLSEDLEKEKTDRNEALEKERIQAEHDFYEKILKTIYKVDELQKTNQL